MEVELKATAHGWAFSLRRIPPRFTKTVAFRDALIVAALGLLAMLQTGLFPLMLYVCITTAQLLVAGVYWLVHRRGVAAVNDALINLVWSVWAPSLEDASPGMYRGPAALSP